MLPKKFYLDNIFDNFMDDENMTNMKCDIYQKDNCYHIEADIPGIDKKDITVECNDGYLTISAVKDHEENKEEKDFIRQERFYGQIKRKFYVGKVDEEAIKASFDNGVLKIIVPKEDKEKSKKVIEIN